MKFRTQPFTWGKNIYLISERDKATELCSSKITQAWTSPQPCTTNVKSKRTNLSVEHNTGAQTNESSHWSLPFDVCWCFLLTLSLVRSLIHLIFPMLLGSPWSYICYLSWGLGRACSSWAKRGWRGGKVSLGRGRRGHRGRRGRRGGGLGLDLDSTDSTWFINMI